MELRSTQLKIAGLVLMVAVGLAIASTAGAADDPIVKVKARALSTMNIERAAADLIDIEISRWSSAEERERLVKALESGGNAALADLLKDQPEIGAVSFDPRGGGGPGRDPRPTPIRYSREVITDGLREITLVTNNYIGYGNDPQAADGAKLANFPISFVLLKLRQDDDGKWRGVGRLFVGAKLRYDVGVSNFVIDEFPIDPVYLKDVKIK
ncbi:MAG: hypothetical protein MUC56_15320 [Thermoanaerobaculales bacterium]|jgi:hypothetical protein|nr:hypothetical protein [Thermoanaerobaculales bacterium]